MLNRFELHLIVFSCVYKINNEERRKKERKQIYAVVIVSLDKDVFNYKPSNHPVCRETHAICTSKELKLFN